METMAPKAVRESAIEDHSHALFPNDLNANQTAFGGRIIEIADRQASIVARRHSGLVCVTLGVDSVRFLGSATEGEVLIFKTAVNRVWLTSMEVGVKVFAENFKTGEKRHVVSAYFTFVAIDENHKPIPIRPAVPETPEEKRRHKEADRRRAARLGQKSSKKGGAPMEITIERLYPEQYGYAKAINLLLPQLSKSAPPITELDFQNNLVNNSDFYLFGVKDKAKNYPDDLAGMAVIFFRWRPEGWMGEIHSVVVDENYRGQHIGDLLTEAMLNAARLKANRTGRKITLYLTSRPSREAANKLYLKHGFVLVAKAEGENGTNLYKLEVTP